jgi:hypothetical protein
VQICRSRGHKEGEGALLEQKGDVSGALTLLLEQLEGELALAEAAGDAREEWARAATRLASGVRLCQRGGGTLLDQSAREALFFPLLRSLTARRQNSNLTPFQQDGEF